MDLSVWSVNVARQFLRAPNQPTLIARSSTSHVGCLTHRNLSHKSSATRFKREGQFFRRRFFATPAPQRSPNNGPLSRISQFIPRRLQPNENVVFRIQDLRLPSPLRPVPPTHKIDWALDMANILSVTQRQEVNKMIQKIYADLNVQICLVTVPNLPVGYRSPKYAATDIFNHFGIGDADLNNGVLVFFSMKDRRVEIELGAGMTYVLPERFLDEVLHSVIVPLMKARRPSSAIINSLALFYPMIKRNRAKIGVLTSTDSSYQSDDTTDYSQFVRNVNWGDRFGKYLATLMLIGAFLFSLWTELPPRCPKCGKFAMFEDAVNRPQVSEYRGRLYKSDTRGLERGTVRLARETCRNCGHSHVIKKSIERSKSRSGSRSGSSWSSSSSSRPGGFSSGGGRGASW